MPDFMEPPPLPYKRRAIFTVAAVGMLIFGVVLTTVGALLPDIIARFDVTKAAAGALFLVLTFAILVASLLFGPAVDRFGYRGPLALASVLVSIGLVVIGAASSLAMVRVGIALIGFGGGVVNGGANAVVADIAEEGKAADLSLLGVFFGIGAVGMPFLLGTLQNTVPQSTILIVLGVASLLAVVLTLITEFPSPKQAHGFPVSEALQLVREPALLIFGLMLFLESGMEITMGGWSNVFAKEALALSGRNALYFLSLYWLGMMVARLLLGSILKRGSPTVALAFSYLTAFVGACLLIFSATTLLAAIGVFLVGAGFAGVFPIVLGWVAERFAALSGTAFSIALVMALTGGMLLPYLTGVLGDQLGLRTSLIIVPVALIFASLLLLISRRN